MRFVLPLTALLVWATLVAMGQASPMGKLQRRADIPLVNVVKLLRSLKRQMCTTLQSGFTQEDCLSLCHQIAPTLSSVDVSDIVCPTECKNLHC